jgi:hypothetical protein
MSINMVIFLSLGVLALLLVSINVFLFVYSYKTNKKLDRLLEKGKIKSFKDIFMGQKEKNDELGEKIQEAFSKIKDLEETSEITVQKIGIVRFNPFNNVGGNQSFVVALLNGNDDGFLISSLFVEDGNRVYAKTVRQGKSDYALSKEEMDAIEKAMNKK